MTSAHAARDNEVVHARCRQALHGLTFLIPMVLYATGSQATIEDTGSTNRPGLRVTIDHDGHATVEQRNGQIDQVKLPGGLCSQFMRDLKEVGPLASIPARHCMKSVSFGSRLFVEFERDKSPDLSCPGQPEPRIGALQKDAQQILAAAREAARIQQRNIITVRPSYSPKS